MSSPLKSWLNDIPDETSISDVIPPAKAEPKTPSIPKGTNLDQLVEFIQRKRAGNSKKEEAQKRLRAMGLKAYQRIKESA